MIRDYIVESFGIYDNAVEAFMNMDEDSPEAYEITKAACNEFTNDYKDILSKEDDWDYIDSIYQMKRDFVKKYKDFALKCKDIGKLGGVSGYGLNDAIKLKVKDLCRAVDYNFPYGWK